MNFEAPARGVGWIMKKQEIYGLIQAVTAGIAIVYRYILGLINPVTQLLTWFEMGDIFRG